MQGLFRQLGLSGVQREQFIKNLSDYEERNSDLNAAAEALGIEINAPEIGKARGELYADHATAQKALLGEDGYRKLQGFDRTASMRESVANLAGLAAVNGVAFSPMQAEQLVSALAEAVPAYRTGGRASLVDAEPVAVQVALARVLTTEQQAVLATQEAPGGAGGLFHPRWNAELNRATRLEKEAAAVAVRRGDDWAARASWQLPCRAGARRRPSRGAYDNRDGRRQAAAPRPICGPEAVIHFGRCHSNLCLSIQR